MGSGQWAVGSGQGAVGSGVQLDERVDRAVANLERGHMRKEVVAWLG